MEDGSLKLVEGSGDLFSQQKLGAGDDSIISQNGDDMSKFTVTKRPNPADRSGVRTGGNIYYFDAIFVPFSCF